jgi:hypothetical protein
MKFGDGMARDVSIGLLIYNYFNVAEDCLQHAKII